MGERIEDVGSVEFARLFVSFQHTAYRLETLQRYDVSYELKPYRAFLAGEPRPPDPSKDAWTGMIRDSVAAGKRLQRVHVVIEPPTDYLRYELEWSYAPNVAAGEDIRILPVQPGQWPDDLPRQDYWLFDSRHLWTMAYDKAGAFRYAERTDETAQIVRHAYWRDAALHLATPYEDYMHRMRESRRAS